MARGGRGGRGGRAGSSEPTRSSRRLRSSQEPEAAAPLLEGLPAAKKSRGRPKKTEIITEEVEEAESYEDAPATSSDTQNTSSSNDPAEHGSSAHETLPTSENEPTITIEKTEVITIDDQEDDEQPAEAPHATIETDEATSPYDDLYIGEQQSRSVPAEKEQKECSQLEEKPRKPRRKSHKLLLPKLPEEPKRQRPVTKSMLDEDPIGFMQEAVRLHRLEEARKQDELKKKKEAELARYALIEQNRAFDGYASDDDAIDGDMLDYRYKKYNLVPMTGDLVAAKMADGAFLGRSITGSDDRNLFAHPTLPRESVDALKLLFVAQTDSDLLSVVQNLDQATVKAFITTRRTAGQHPWRDPNDSNHVKHMLEFATHYITDLGAARRLLVNTRLQLEHQAERNRELEMMHEKDQEAIEMMQKELASGKQQSSMRPPMKAKRNALAATPQSSSSKRRYETDVQAAGETTPRPSKQVKTSHPTSNAGITPHPSGKHPSHVLSATHPRQAIEAAARDREAKRFFEAEQRKEAQRKRDKATSDFRRRHGRAPNNGELDAALGIERPERIQPVPTSPTSASTPARNEPETPSQVPTAVRDRFGLSSVWRSIGSAFVRPFSFASPQRPHQQAAEPSTPTPISHQAPGAESTPSSHTAQEQSQQTSNAPSSAADQDSDMDEATTTTPRPQQPPQTPHTQQQTSVEDNEDMGEDAQMPTTPPPAPAPANQGQTNTTQGTQNPQTSVKTGRQAKPVMQRMREQKERDRRKEKERRVEEAAAKQKQERQEKEKEDARIAVIQAKRDKEYEHLKKYPLPNAAITEFHRLRDQGIHVGMKRKVRADWLDPIPEREDGSFAVPEPDDDEEWGTEVYYLTNKGYLTDKKEGDVIYNYDEIDREEAVKKGLASPPAKRTRFGENLERGPTAAPSWKTSKPGPFSGSLNDVGLRSALKPSTSFGMSTGPSDRAQPYTGATFGDGSPGGGAGANVFGSPNSRKRKHDFTAEEERAIAYGQKNHVWTGPKIAPKPGQFSVPDDSDDDTDSVVSDRDTSEMSLVDSDKAVTPDVSKSTDASHQEQPRSVFWDKFQADVAAKRAADAVEQAKRDGKAADEITRAEKAAEEAAQKAKDTRAGTLKPTETPSGPKQPSSFEGSATPSASNANPEAVARARAQAEKWKPKTPSKLQEASRLSSSPIVPHSDAHTPRENVVTASTPTPAGGQTTAAVETSSNAPTMPTPAGGSSTAAVEEAGGRVMTDEYRKSLQYARDLAGQAPLTDEEDVYKNFQWPNGEPTVPTPAGGSSTAAVEEAGGKGMTDEYRKSLQYARDLAVQAPLTEEEDIYKDFQWPQGETIQGPATGDPEVAAAIQRWMASPQFEVDVAAWDHVWAPHRKDAPAATV